ncbi:MAG: GyrI-like domain-containing protein [Bacteroidia bacterium]
MKSLLFKFSLLLSTCAVLFSCGSDNSEFAQKPNKDTVLKTNQKVMPFTMITNKEGIIGIFDVPEIITICKLDSAPLKDVSFKVAKDYGVLEEEMNAIGAEMGGMPGMLTYSNDTSNFIFECVLPLKAMPKFQPKTCKIVVLEATPMLMYNFYGPYQHLFAAYSKIKMYMTENKLVQSGPMREFYLSDPTLVKDPAKWQTRVMVPVGRAK